MSLDALSSAIDAIRAADGDAGAGADDGELAAATRLRVMRSLESRARGRHQLVGLATAVAILLGGTVSWALATGQVAALWSPAPMPLAPPAAPPAAPHPPAPVRRHPASAPRPVPVAPAPAELPAPVEPLAMSIDPRPTPVPDASPPAVIPPAPRPATAPRAAHSPAPPAPPVEALYRRAHELHFHGGDPAAALAAWDAYLAAEPTGLFSVEARYNRALLLVRLGRHAEARAALLPFARGEVQPEGYRQPEAEQLVERLAHYE
jgi:hypothetical protein